MAVEGECFGLGNAVALQSYRADSDADTSRIDKEGTALLAKVPRPLSNQFVCICITLLGGRFEFIY
jgi:hypothetical protein